MQITTPVEYGSVSSIVPLLAKTGRTELYGFVIQASASGTLSVYDGTSAAGTLLLNAIPVTTGQVIHFGGVGITFKNGLYVTMGGTAAAMVLYK